MLPSITIFTSIPGIEESLSETKKYILSLIVLKDDALGGYGGTVEFNPANLSEKTKCLLKEAEILISEPAVIAKLLEYDESILSSLRWCQSTYAGVDPIFNSKLIQAKLPLHFTLTRFAGCFGPPIAEWCLARIISHERQFQASTKDQQSKSWAASQDKILGYRYLSSLTLSILGCGDIGKCIASAAKMFGMKTIGFGKTTRAPSENVDQYTTDLNHALQAADYIVSVLPSTSETRGLLSHDALKPASKENGGKCPVFLNVGRGDVIAEESIIYALDNAFISAAILDVFEIEPLPTESKLWERTDVVISPHVSGLTQAKDVPKVFLFNYERYINKDELQFVVDWNKGY